jgi:hypothetical protein
MERFKVNCEISDKSVELQFDVKKMSGEIGPCYMVSIDGHFKGYVKKEKTGRCGQLMNSDFSKEDMLVIITQLGRLIC